MNGRLDNDDWMREQLDFLITKNLGSITFNITFYTKKFLLLTDNV